MLRWTRSIFYIVQHSAFFFKLQPDNGRLEAETCSWLAVTIVCYMHIIYYICVLTFKSLLFNFAICLFAIREFSICLGHSHSITWRPSFNPLNAKLNPIYHFLTLLGAHPIFHISRIRVKQLIRFGMGQEFFSVISEVSHSISVCLSTTHCSSTYLQRTLQYLPFYLMSYFLVCFY
jgi:hypothetical protein